MTGTRAERLRALLASRRLGRWIAYALVAGAVLATGVRLAGEDSAGEATTKLHAPVLPADPLSAELARCRAITDPAAVDDACRAAWAENRRRFLNLHKAQDRLGSDINARSPAAPKDE
jgi:conjugative transfer region protein TrbK